MNINENEFKTSDINLSIFLCTKNFRLLRIENSSERKTFVFSDTPQLKHLVEVFFFGEDDNPEIMVDARKLFRASKELKNKLYSVEYQ